MAKKVLVIENDQYILELLIDLLPRFGYEVEGTKKGCEALEKLARMEYDAILLDVHLEELDGKTVYRKLKDCSSGLAERVIFMTGDIGNTNTASFINECGNLWLQKPFTLGEASQILEAFFKEKS